MASNWNQDYLDLIDAFAEEGVEFVVVGAFALAAHGHPRATGDIDVFVRASEPNAERVLKALVRFGAPVHAAGVSARDFVTPGAVYQLGVVPRRIDVITEISGVTFDEAWSSRVHRTIDGRTVAFLGLAELLRNKRSTGRPKDVADVAALEALKPQR